MNAVVGWERIKVEGKVPNNNHVHVDSHLTLMDSDAEADSTLGSQNDTATPHSRCYVFYVLRTGSENDPTVLCCRVTIEA